MAETVRRKKLYKNTNFYKPNSKMVDRRHIYILPYPTDTEFYTPSEENFITYGKIKSSPDSCVKCYTMFLPFLLIKIDVFS